MDRLKEIKKRLIGLRQRVYLTPTEVADRDDIEWLVAEVERLRKIVSRSTPRKVELPESDWNL